MLRPSTKSILLLIPAATVLWTVFGLVMFALGGAAAFAKGYDTYDIAFNLIWQSNWLLWIPGTFVAFFLARRFPVEKGSVSQMMLVHCGLGVLIVVVMSLAEYAMNFPLRAFANFDPIPPDYIIAFAGYKGPFNFAIYLGHVLAINGYDLFSRFRNSQLKASQLEAKLHQAELQTLKMQLQPHFLFNTHNSIMALMVKGDTKGATKMLSQLSDLLRITLEKTDQQCSSVAEEIETLDLYLGIQAVRFQDRWTSNCMSTQSACRPRSRIFCSSQSSKTRLNMPSRVILKNEVFSKSGFPSLRLSFSYLSRTTGLVLMSEQRSNRLRG
jgi:two-component system LytT family sensor kinase